MHKKELDIARAAGVFAEDARLVMLTTMSNSVSDGLYVAAHSTYMNAMSPFGRSTRGFIAYSYSELMTLKGQANAVSLKDTWRILDRPEVYTFYAELEKNNLPYIPSVIRSLNIQDQRTIVQGLCEEDPFWAEDVPQGLCGFQPYRLILKEVGTPLTEFSSTRELMTIMYQALQAHALAYTKAQVLHRDITGRNIMISELDGEGNRTALLSSVDWGMARFRDGKSPSASRKTGTWQFAAGRLLDNDCGLLEHVLQDDLESFVHVLTWVVFRYTQVAFPFEALSYHMHRLFNEGYCSRRSLVQGCRKMELQCDHVVLDAKIKIVNPALHYLLLDIRAAIAIR